jgi:hypothetical protein
MSTRTDFPRSHVHAHRAIKAAIAERADRKRMRLPSELGCLQLIVEVLRVLPVDERRTLARLLLEAP